jgi:type II secretory pathway component PulC
MYAMLVIVGVGAAKFGYDFLIPKFAPKKTVAAAAKPRVATTPQAFKPATPYLPAPLEAVKKKIKQVAIPFELNGIMFSDNDKSALVNNKIVQEGDTVDGAQVTRISEESVELSREGKTITLTTRNK